MIKRLLERFDIDNVINDIINIEWCLFVVYTFILGMSSDGYFCLDSSSAPVFVVAMTVITILIADTSYLEGRYYVLKTNKERDK